METCIALVGNPNVGKSTIFNALTGMKQHTGNWAGKTVEMAKGTYIYKEEKYQLIDLPGTYSLEAQSNEEFIAKRYIQEKEFNWIIVICDGTCLERNLILALQILGICENVILCVNMLDEAKKRKINIDLDGLAKDLNIPVIGLTAQKKGEIERLKEFIYAVNNNFKRDLATNEDCYGVDYVTKSHKIYTRNVKNTEAEFSKKDALIDKVVTGKITAFPVMFIFLTLIFWITIVLANIPSNILSSLFSKFEIMILSALNSINCPEYISGPLILGGYRVLAWVVSVMLPPMAIFFPLFTILEDFGYLPRIAYNMDKMFKWCGGCGKQALTMSMGFGCNAVGVTGCRIIDSKKERLLSMLTNVFVPCNGRFPALIVLISIFFVESERASLKASIILTSLIVFGVFVTMILNKLLSKSILKGETSCFILELPPYRRPQFKSIIIRSVLDRTLFVLGRAVSVAGPCGILLWIFANCRIGETSILDIIVQLLNPLGMLIGLDGVILTAFLLGISANEIVLPIMIMIYSGGRVLEETGTLFHVQSLLEANGWTFITVICTMVFFICHWPCATTLLTIKKEAKEVRWVLLSFIIPTITGLVICFVLSKVLCLWI